jgi:hypothetical protein
MVRHALPSHYIRLKIHILPRKSSSFFSEAQKFVAQARFQEIEFGSDANPSGLILPPAGRSSELFSPHLEISVTSHPRNQSGAAFNLVSGSVSGFSEVRKFPAQNLMSLLLFRLTGKAAESAIIPIAFRCLADDSSRSCAKFSICQLPCPTSVLSAALASSYVSRTGKNHVVSLDIRGR